MPDELWMEVRDIVQETGIKTIPKKNKRKKAKWLFEEALQIAEKREVKGKGEKERYTHLNAEFHRIARRDKKSFLSDQCKEIEENNRMQRVEISSENQRYQGNNSCKDGLNKGQKWYGSNRSRRYEEEVAIIYRRTIQKHLHDPDNHDGVITHLEPDILECEVKWALGRSL